MGQQDAFDRIVASLHEAALGDAHWRPASVLIDETCGTKGTHLCIIDNESRMLFDQVYYRGDFPKEMREEYVRHYFPRDERIPRILRLPDCHVAHVPDLLTARERKTSPTYHEGLVRWLSQDGLNIRMDGPQGANIVWALADSTRPDGWSSAQLAMIERLLPHIRHFVRVRQALAGGDALNASLAALLDNANVGVIFLDGRGVIVEANNRARATLRRGDGLEDRGGYLRTRVAADDVRLGNLLARVLAERGGPGVGGSMSVQRSRLSSLAVHVTPVPGRAGAFVIGGAAVLVLVVDPGAQPRLDVERVGAALGLTQAESRVAVALAEGASVRDIATTTGRQESSVRWLIKQIHAKLEIPRNADLVRIVLSAAWGTRPPPSEDAAPTSEPPTQRRSLVTPLSQRRGSGR